MSIAALHRILLCATLLGVVSCGKQQQSEERAAGSPSSSNIAQVTNVTLRGGLAPNFTWKDAAGKQIDFDSFRGKVTLINFWATWCGPCKRELPDLVALSKELSEKNVKIIGVSVDRGVDVANDVKNFVEQHGIPYQVVIASDELVEAFGNISAIPTSFIVDQQGKITQTLIGMRSKEAFAQALTPFLQ